jgi:hypothetical protein
VPFKLTLDQTVTIVQASQPPAMAGMAVIFSPSLTEGVLAVKK